MPGLLKRVKGDARLAARLLDDFRRTHRDTPGRIANAQAKGQAAEAHRLAHTLAGLAGNLGLAQLSAAARAVEHALMQVGSAPAEALERLSAEAAAALAATEAVEPPPALASAGTAADIAALAESLDALLADSDLGALQRSAELETAAPSAATRAVRDAVERLDFKEARTLLVPLREGRDHG